MTDRFRRPVLAALLRAALPLGARFALVAGLAAAPAAQAQAPAAEGLEVLGLSVEGASDVATRDFVLQTLGLRVGQRLAVPADDNLADGIRRVYELGSFSDVSVEVERELPAGVFLVVRVTEVPRVGEYAFTGIKGGMKDDLKQQIPLLRGRPLRPADLERSEQVIKAYLAEKGYYLASVRTEIRDAAENRQDVTFHITRGGKIEIGDLAFEGNAAFSDRKLRGVFDETKEDRWWRFWGATTYDQAKYEADLQALLGFYRDRGYYGVRILGDTVYVEERGGKPMLTVRTTLEEGPQYHVRDVVFEGNTEYSDAALKYALGIEKGEVYDAGKIERNLYYNPEHSDISSLYTDRGYLRFDVTPTIVEVPGDSLDLFFEVNEGDVYDFGQVKIAGNTKTKDHVVRRSIRTVPGQTYSRQAIERSIRELMQLGYFDQETLTRGPSMEVDEEGKTVGLTYRVAEAGGDQLELSGGWGGYSGLILQAGVTFNNFSIQNVFNGSAWNPIPAGDGQRLSLQVQTNGLSYQNYGVSFTEPWFRGRPTPVGFSLNYTYRDLSRYTLTGAGADDAFRSFSASTFYRQQLKWPDDYFQTGTTLGYRLYDVQGNTFSSSYGLPEGVSQEFTISQSLSRNSVDNPILPTNGSTVDLSVTVAAPVPGFVQYHKERLATTWTAPLVPKLAFQFSGDWGYIGSLSGDEVEFQRFLVGGSPLDTQSGYVGYGKDLLFMRGYPLGAISPRRDGRLVGGRILNKYGAELRWNAVSSQQLQVAPYLFADAANTWNSFDDFNPLRLYRAAGFGAKVFLPILGMVDLNYGYALDAFPDTRTGLPVPPQWRFQFSLGGR